MSELKSFDSSIVQTEWQCRDECEKTKDCMLFSWKEISENGKTQKNNQYYDRCLNI